ncbi:MULTISPECIES: M15 family metallopeptidase [Isoptericola]|uniref:M15 family metallopeptidase n=1 Tax=Isoptericola TaxID=254250 RepID=UPI000D08170E|nr:MULTISPECIES: M15 family metallopeptidase [Isoptericola]
MSTRRFTLPRLRQTRNSGRHLQQRTRRTTDSARTYRTGIAALTAVLALTAGTATAVGPLTGGAGENSSTPAAESAPSTDPTAGSQPSAGTTASTATDATEVAATTALQRAEHVITESTSVSRKQQKKIAAQADEVTEILTSRSDEAASRSAERTPLPAPALRGEDTAEEPPADDAPATAEPSASSAPAETEPSGTEAEPEPEAEPSAEPEAAAGDAEAAEAEAALTAATEELTVLLEDAESTVEVDAAPPTPAEILANQKAKADEAAAELAKQAGSVAAYENGQIPTAAMCELSFAPGETLRCDAGAQLERLDRAYKAKFGSHLSITDSYRSYASQVATKAAKGYLAAVPGHSNHGWGVAVDLGDGVESFGTAQYDWLRENAPAFGWDNPGWARADGRKPEAWHWEYTPLD